MKQLCPYCHSNKVQRRGNYPKQRYQCRQCNRYFYGETSPARVLLFDIETLPGEKYFWSMGEEDWNPDSIIRDWCVLSYSVKWLFEPMSESNALTPRQALEHDDGQLMDEIHWWLSQADVVVAHNGDAFDLSKVNTRFLFHDMQPPSPYISVDTYTTARKAFGFTSNKLAYLAKYLGLNPKLHTDYDLWVRCAHGDKEAIEYMRKYNEQDIFTLEDVYVKLRPWIKHPNMSLYLPLKKGEHACPHCASSDISWDYSYRTPARVYPAFRCKRCGAIGRDYKSVISATDVRVIK